MKKIKEYTYDKNTSWQGYIDFVKQHVGREISEIDYKSMMQYYISSRSPDLWISENK